MSLIAFVVLNCGKLLVLCFSLLSMCAFLFFFGLNVCSYAFRICYVKKIGVFFVGLDDFQS